MQVSYVGLAAFCVLSIAVVASAPFMDAAAWFLLLCAACALFWAGVRYGQERTEREVVGMVIDTMEINRGPRTGGRS